jgi:hypothetical protein
MLNASAFPPPHLPPASGFTCAPRRHTQSARQRVYVRSALTYPKQHLLRAAGSEKGGWHTRLEAPASGFTCAPRRHTQSARQRVYVRSALTYPKRHLLRAAGSEKGAWHTRLEAPASGFTCAPRRHPQSGLRPLP